MRECTFISAEGYYFFSAKKICNLKCVSRPKKAICTLPASLWCSAGRTSFDFQFSSVLAVPSQSHSCHVGFVTFRTFSITAPHLPAPCHAWPAAFAACFPEAAAGSLAVYKKGKNGNQNYILVYLRILCVICNISYMTLSKIVSATISVEGIIKCLVLTLDYKLCVQCRVVSSQTY